MHHATPTGEWVSLESVNMIFNVSPVHQSSPLVQSSDCRCPYHSHESLMGKVDTTWFTISNVGVQIKICLSQQQPISLKKAWNDDSNCTYLNEIEWIQ